MPGFEALAPDQKAVLQLLLKQGKTYAQIAELLRLDPASVRERALDALDALGADHVPAAEPLAPERQDELADHLLLQQDPEQRAATQAFLASSPAGRAWARAVAAELAPVAGSRLPEIPDEPEEPAESTEAVAPARTPAAVGSVVAPGADDDERAEAGERPERASRLGGAILLGLLGLIAVIAIVLLVSRGGDDPKPATRAATGATAAPIAKTSGRCELPAAAATGTTGKTPIEKAIAVQGTAKLQQQQINLKVPGGSGSKALGFAIVTPNGLAFQAEGLTENENGYKVWLWNSPTEAFPLGFAVYDRATKRYAGTIAALPAAARSCGQLVLTRETSASATRPGSVALAGAIKAAAG